MALQTAFVQPNLFLAPAPPRAQQAKGFASSNLALGGLTAAAAVIAVRNRKLARNFVAQDKNLIPIWPPVTGEYCSENMESAGSPDFAGGLAGSELSGASEVLGAPVYQFDPLKFSVNFPELLPWFRESELKHGRVAMLAVVGALAQESFRFPFPESQDTTINIVNAHSKLLAGGLGQGPMWYLLLAVGVIESFRFKQLGLGFQQLNLETAGDLGFGKATMGTTPEGQLAMRTKELKNGRLAMLAFGGIITQAALYGGHYGSFNFPWA